MSTVTAPPRLAAAAAQRRRDARRTQAARVVADSAIWLTSLSIVALWVAGGGIQSLFSSDAMTSLGRITGLVASNLLLFQVVLMARLPVIERAYGHDALTRAHRLTGFWSFWLMLAHIVLITIGYSTTGSVGLWDQFWDFVWNYPAMLLATVATILLILVVALSIRAARRRLRYESWHLIHLYAYLGVGLAIPHQLWTGADFLSSPLATAYWWGLWAFALASVLVFRLGIPLVRSLRHQLRVTAVERDGDGGVSIEMTGQNLESLHTRAGQFFIWRFLDGPGWMRGHPFSIAAAPAKNRLRIAVRIAGDGTERLARMRVGTHVLIEGPYGGLTGERRRGRRLLMLGAGAGVAPLVSLLEAEGYANGEATLVTRDTTAEGRLRADAIQSLVDRRGLRHIPLDGVRSRTTDPWLPEQYSAWTGPDMLRYLEPDLGELDVYVCGPTAWMDAVITDLDAVGLPAGRIHTEHFSI